MAAAGLASGLLWLPLSHVVAAGFSDASQTCTTQTVPASAGGITTVHTRTLTDLPAGRYAAAARAWISTSQSGTLVLKWGSTDMDSVGTHSPTGTRVLYGTLDHAGGTVTVTMIHVGEAGGNVVYGQGSSDCRFARDLLVWGVVEAGGAGSTGPAGPTGPPGPTGATGPPGEACPTPTASAEVDCIVDIASFSGEAADLVQLSIFVPVLVGALVIFTLAWIAMQGLRR